MRTKCLQIIKLKVLWLHLNVVRNIIDKLADFVFYLETEHPQLRINHENVLIWHRPACKIEGNVIKLVSWKKERGVIQLLHVFVPFSKK
jgi:hypothetical protein